MRDLRPGLQGLYFKALIVLDLGPVVPVTASKQATSLVVRHVLVADETGSVLLVLWNELVHAFVPSDIVSISSAYTSLNKEQLVLNVGPQGRIERIGE